MIGSCMLLINLGLKWQLTTAFIAHTKVQQKKAAVKEEGVGPNKENQLKASGYIGLYPELSGWNTNKLQYRRKLRKERGQSSTKEKIING